MALVADGRPKVGERAGRPFNPALALLLVEALDRKRTQLDENLTTWQVARQTGASLRQLQWWDEKNLVVVHHEGHKRIYTPKDAAKVHSLTKLRRAGISLQACRRLLRRDPDRIQVLCEAIAVVKKFGLHVAQ